MYNPYHKPFDKKLCAENDPSSRKVVREYYQKQGIVLVDNPNTKGIDLIAPDGTFVEVERRVSAWRTGEWPWPDINIPKRKGYLAEGKSRYVIVSADYKFIGILEADVAKTEIIDENLHFLRNKFMPDGEYLYKVLPEKFKWISLDEKALPQAANV